jgi:lipoate-protein ligase A
MIGSRPIQDFGADAEAVLPGMVPGEPWWLLDSGVQPAAWNMAFDEALLEAAPRLGRPVLRFYGWTEPAATFGYSQSYREIESLTALRPLVRRPTGGGLVPHNGDWTYTLVFPPGHPWFGLRARASYERVHGWVCRAFTRLGLPTKLAPVSLPGHGQCFVGAEQFDVLLAGAKIAGAAQRRTRTGLLIQGSVQPPFSAPPRRLWQQALCDVADEAWDVTWSPLTPDAALLERATELTREKYALPTHNQGR